MSYWVMLGHFGSFGVEKLETITLVLKLASDHPYLERKETLCCNTVIVTVIVTLIVVIVGVIVVIWVIAVIWVIWVIWVI